jgi:3-oxoacyl-[acyl-carrier-protein] synthase III
VALRMAGQTVFRWAVTKMGPVAKRALDLAGVTPEELGAFVPHQANLRIVESLVKTLKLPSSVVVARDIETQGNTSSASIPLALSALLQRGEVESGQPALFIGFGAGLTYAAQVVEIP